MNAKELFEIGQDLFSKRSTLMNLWQETADNFYPERADFTVRRTVGINFADYLTTSYPVLARRDLGNSLGSMLRPTAKEWFHTGVVDDDKLDNDAREYLEWASGVQRRAMYDRKSFFTRATKEGDHDYAAFGQCVISIELNRQGDGLLYRCWHLRDMAWVEDENGDIGARFRKWKPTARDLTRLFGPDACHTQVGRKLEKDPFCEIECVHIVVPADMWSGDEARRAPWVSIYYDVTHQHTIEVVPLMGPFYVIPRWQTVSGSQYAYSPATIAALPDARLIQAMTTTLLEAGEKITNPPMIAVQDAIRSDVSIYAGGITWVDAEYDEREGAVLRPITQDAKGMPIGIDMQRDCRAMIHEAFYLNKLAMPERSAEMTAFEVGQRIQEYIRQALPIFEPMELDYNGAICEETFNILLRGGAFGSPMDMPKALQGREIRFRFESPLHDAIERQKGQRFMEAKALIAEGIALDQTIASLPDVKTAMRDCLIAIGTPAKWLHTEAEVEAFAQQQIQKQQTQELLANMQAGSDIAKTIGEARQAGAMPAEQAAV